MTAAPSANTDERDALSQDAAGMGWQRNEQQRIDLYKRDGAAVRVLWRGSAAISGAARFEDYALLTTTRDLATVRKWLAR